MPVSSTSPSAARDIAASLGIDAKIDAIPWPGPSTIRGLAGGDPLGSVAGLVQDLQVASEVECDAAGRPTHVVVRLGRAAMRLALVEA